MGEPRGRRAAVREATPEDVDRLLELYRTLYRHDAERHMATLDDTPEDLVLRRVAVVDGEVVGHVAEISVPVWVDGRRRASCTRVHWVVSPAAQGNGVGSLLTANRGTVEMFDMVLTMPNRRGARSLWGNPRFTMVGSVRSWCRWRRPEAMTEPRLAKVPRPVLAAGLAFVAALGRAASTWGLEVTDRPPADAELDALAVASAKAARCLRIRDAAFVRWRRHGNPDLQLTSVRDRRGRLRAWALHGRARADPCIGGAADFYADGPRALRALLVHVGDRLIADGCDVVLAPHLDPRRWSRVAVLAAGFVPRGPGRHVFVRAAAADLRGVCDQPGAWYLTLADGDHV